MYQLLLRFAQLWCFTAMFRKHCNGLPGFNVSAASQNLSWQWSLCCMPSSISGAKRKWEIVSETTRPSPSSRGTKSRRLPQKKALFWESISGVAFIPRPSKWNREPAVKSSGSSFKSNAFMKFKESNSDLLVCTHHVFESRDALIKHLRRSRVSSGNKNEHEEISRYQKLIWKTWLRAIKSVSGRYDPRKRRLISGI